MKQIIPLSEPCLRANEWRYVKECLDTGWVSSVGGFVDRFETAVAAYTGRRHAVATSTGTAALHTALMVAGVGEGDEVLVPALTFAAPAFAVRYTGAWPVFIDVEPQHWQMDIQKVADFLSQECKMVNGKLVNRRTRRRIKAVIPVHLLGHAVDMPALMKLTRLYGLWVIEDVAESIGAEAHGRKTGFFGDMACFSFNGNKIVTCGGGGMLATHDKKLAARARHLTTQAKSGGIEYVHDAIGYNYRLTNIQAAMGVAQMESLEKFVTQKRDVARRYTHQLQGLEGVVLPREASWAKSIFWLYTILIDAKAYGMDSRALMRRLIKAGIQSRPLWQPLSMQKIFQGAYAYQVTEAKRLYRQALSLPSSMTLGRGQQKKIIALIAQR